MSRLVDRVIFNRNVNGLSRWFPVGRSLLAGGCRHGTLGDAGPPCHG